jgi:hypothetical protein
MSQTHRRVSGISTLREPKFSLGIQPKLEMRERLRDDFTRLRPEGKRRVHPTIMLVTEVTRPIEGLSVFWQVRVGAEAPTEPARGAESLPPTESRKHRSADSLPSSWNRSSNETRSVLRRKRRGTVLVKDTQPES